MSIRPALVAIPLAGILLLASCSAPAEADADATTAPAVAAHTVATDYGDVEIPADPQTVVVLNYALAGYLYDLEVPVTATIPEDADGDGEFSEFWADEAEAQDTAFLPWSADGFDLESILALDPDLIVGGGWGFPLFQAAQAYDDLSAIAPTVLVSGDFTTWQEQYAFLAEDVFQQPAAYDEAVAAYDARVAEVSEAITPPEAPAAILAMTADQTAYVMYDGEALPSVLEEVGIEIDPSLTPDTYAPYTDGGDMFELSTEQVGQVLTQPTLFVTGFNGAPVDVAALEENAVYAALPSFASSSGYDLPYWVNRADFDETMALLDILEETFS